MVQSASGRELCRQVVGQALRMPPAPRDHQRPSDGHHGSQPSSRQQHKLTMKARLPNQDIPLLSRPPTKHGVAHNKASEEPLPSQVPTKKITPAVAEAQEKLARLSQQEASARARATAAKEKKDQQEQALKKAVYAAQQEQKVAAAAQPPAAVATEKILGATRPGTGHLRLRIKMGKRPPEASDNKDNKMAKVLDADIEAHQAKGREARKEKLAKEKAAVEARLAALAEEEEDLELDLLPTPGGQSPMSSPPAE